MVRKIIFNIIIGYVLFPIFLIFREWNNFINGIYKYEDIVYESLYEYLIDYLHTLAYPLVPTIFLLIVLLPFQLIKDSYFNRFNKPLNLWLKFVVLVLILFLVYFFLITRGHMKNFWLSTICFGAIYTLILYFTVDRYVETPKG